MARLATIGVKGPHIVPITFALIDDRVVTAVDHKPKTTAALQRLTNIERDPRVALLVDHYDDHDWSVLWWCRLDGIAMIERSGSRHERSIDALVSKYGQYREHRPAGPVISIQVTRVTGWSAGS